jgi:uncharacterized protein YyaL (SSP411 family)
MLADHAYLLRALIDAAQTRRTQTRTSAIARKLADLSIERLQSPSGGFYDTAYDPTARGVLRHAQRSILENSVMAEGVAALVRADCDLDDYADTARETLAAFATDYKRYGHFVAATRARVDLLFPRADPRHDRRRAHERADARARAGGAPARTWRARHRAGDRSG